MATVTITRPTSGATIMAPGPYVPSLSFMIAGEVTGNIGDDGRQFPVTRISTRIDNGEEIFIFGLPLSFSYSFFVFRDASVAGSHTLFVTAYVDNLPGGKTIEHVVELPILVVSNWDFVAALYDRSARAMDVVVFDQSGAAVLDKTTEFQGTNVWDLIVPGNFIGLEGVPASALLPSQLVVYDRQADQGGVIGFDASGGLTLDRVVLGWRTSWDFAVAGDFIGSGKRQVLLYDRQAGEADVVGFDGNGAVNLDHTNPGWRSTWNVAVSGNFFATPKSQLLLYDRQAGEIDIVGFDANGVTNLDHTNSGLRKTWDVIVAGNFTAGDFEQVLLYDREAGEANLVTFDANGVINLVHAFSGWRKTWDQIVVLGPIPPERLVLYDRQNGVADYVAFEQNGAIQTDHSNTGWRTSWDLVTVGGEDFGDVLLYDRGAGQADVVRFELATGVTNLDHTNSNWRTSWDQIVSLNHEFLEL